MPVPEGATLPIVMDLKLDLEKRRKACNSNSRPRQRPHNSTIRGYQVRADSLPAALSTNQSRHRVHASQKRKAPPRGDALLNCYPFISINAPPDRFHSGGRCFFAGSSSPLAGLCREDALGSLFEVSGNALVVRQDWIAEPSTTAAGDVRGLVRR